MTRQVREMEESEAAFRTRLQQRRTGAGVVGEAGAEVDGEGAGEAAGETGMEARVRELQAAALRLLAEADTWQQDRTNNDDTAPGSPAGGGEDKMPAPALSRQMAGEEVARGAVQRLRANMAAAPQGSPPAPTGPNFFRALSAELQRARLPMRLAVVHGLVQCMHACMHTHTCIHIHVVHGLV